MQGRIDSRITIGGIDFGPSSIVRDADNAANSQRDLDVGAAGELTTRTDDNTGVATLVEGHGLQSLDVVDVYWDGGCRYGMTATVAGNAVTVDGGAGDSLPTTATDLVVCKQTVIDCPDIVGNNVQMVGAKCAGRAHIDIRWASGSILAIDLAAGESWSWAVGTGPDNPLADKTLVELRVSLGDAVNAATLFFGAMVD